MKKMFLGGLLGFLSLLSLSAVGNPITGEVCIPTGEAESTLAVIDGCPTYTIENLGGELNRYTYRSELNEIVDDGGISPLLVPPLPIITSMFVEFDLSLVTSDVSNASAGFLGLDLWNLGVTTLYGGLWEVDCLGTCTVSFDIASLPVWGSILMSGVSSGGDAFSAYNGNSGGSSNAPVGGPQPFGLVLRPGAKRDPSTEQSVPEPATLPLLALAMLGFTISRKLKTT